jgi:hypothetical protein
MLGFFKIFTSCQKDKHWLLSFHNAPGMVVQNAAFNGSISRPDKTKLVIKTTLIHHFMTHPNSNKRDPKLDRIKT